MRDFDVVILGGGSAGCVVLLERQRTVGAELRRRDGPVRVMARTVIVSAGALHFPAVLMRSGIGPGAALSRLGIPVAAARDGGARNLLDHPSIGVSAFLPPTSRLAAGEHHHIQFILRWSSGMEGTPAGDMHLAVNTRSGWHAVGYRLGTLFNWVNKSYSHGTVELSSPDPAAEPMIGFRLLSDRRDLPRPCPAVAEAQPGQWPADGHGRPRHGQPWAACGGACCKRRRGTRRPSSGFALTKPCCTTT